MPIRHEKNKPSRIVLIGKVTIQQSPARTGKSIRAEAWRKEDPENRRVVDGDRKEAKKLANEGYDVMLNLLPGM